ncbi:adenosylcobinamide-phosphate synthase CbiB [Sphingomonas sp.]|uniref:adenosylcobinamide-phosphate synthase CbiB n=1 Tax=Sphingomonas sp. TaxID=28214 RepID=UPI0025E2B4F9|nr:adenosylcobinamide-phosphate synthase CbiB [Sphingomonas sp.]
MTDRATLLLAALMTEAVIGYPAWLFAAAGHPVSWTGALIARLESDWNIGSGTRRRAMGIAVVGVIIAASGGVGWAVMAALDDGWAVMVFVLIVTTGLAQRSLHDHVAAVARPLAARNLSAARVAVSEIVGRDTQALDESSVSVAAIESLAESFCDGVVAPAFWFLIAGLPGMLICKAVNTADSMIGHRDARHRDFGWAAARTDDLMMLIPARLSGLMIAAAGRGGLPMMWRDARKHASPNGGWPEAAMSSALGRRLGGPVSYESEPSDRAWLGDGPAPDAADLVRALSIYHRACLLLWVIVGVIAWPR